MGGEFITRIFEDCTINELTDKINTVCEEDIYEYGHRGYTGTWAGKNGVIVSDKVFDCKYDAEDWINEHNDKVDPLTAVKLKDGRWVVGGLCSS